MGTFDPDANQRRITKDLAVVGAGAFAASMASAGIALTAAGALGAAGIASAAIAMAGATALAAVAVVAAAALTVQSLALMLCFGCTVGYGLGGLGTSSFNNIHWNFPIKYGFSMVRTGCFKRDNRRKLRIELY